MKDELINELVFLNILDEKTKLYGKISFLTLIHQQLKVSKRSGESLNILFADIDRLSWINDLYGIQHGDLLIQDTAKVLKSTLRDMDVAARIENDLFAVALIQANANSHDLIKKRILQRVNLCNVTTQRPYKLSLTLEILSFKSDESLENMILNANEKLTAQKIKKKNYKLLLGNN